MKRNWIGQQHQHDHQHDRLRRRAAEILAAEAVVVDLVDQDVGGLAGAALGERAHHAEGADEGEEHVDHQQKEAGWRKQRENDVPEAPSRPCAVDGGGLDQRLGDRLQAGQEEQEIVTQLVPHRGEHDQQQSLVAVDHVVELDADAREQPGDDADRRVEQEAPQHASTAGATA
jgi:hypothetical protein